MSSAHRRLAAVLSMAFLTGAPLVAGVLPARAGGPPGAAAPATYASVALIFGRACVHCHGGESAVEGLALDSHAGVLKGSGRGAVVVPGQPEKSALVGRLRGTIQPHMPFDGDPLPDGEIVLIEEWIRSGARDTDPSASAPPPAPAAPPAPVAPVAPVAPLAPVAPPARVAPTGPVTWSDVQPILRAACVRCHQPKGIRGPAPEGLRFDTYDATVGGGERASVIPGRPDASPLLRAVRGQARKPMPLGAPRLKPEAIALLERWIREGARGDDGKAAPIPSGRQVRLFGVFDGAARVDAVVLAVDGGTRIDGAPAAGATVEVRATVLADGSLRATRVRARSPTDGADDGVRPVGDDHGGGGGRGSDDGPEDDHGGGRGRDGGGDDHGGRGRR